MEPPDTRNRATLLAMDLSVVRTEMVPDPSARSHSNHKSGRGDRGVYFSDGANALSVDGAVQWHSFQTGATVWPLGLDKGHDFWVAREANHPPAFAGTYGFGSTGVPPPRITTEPPTFSTVVIP